MTVKNPVKESYRSGKPAYGVWTHASTRSIEIAGLVGFDFIRVDAYYANHNPETVREMVRAAEASHVSPWISCRNDAWTIQSMLNAGAEGITVPNIGTADAARLLVESVFYPPKGRREYHRPAKNAQLSATEYFEWAADEIFVGCQIEGEESLQNYKDIVRVEGLDCVLSGRGDLSLALGVPGDITNEAVVEAEKRIFHAALDAGKQVCLVLGMSEAGIEDAMRWVDQGVRLACMGSDVSALRGRWEWGMKQIRSHEILEVPTP